MACLCDGINVNHGANQIRGQFSGWGETRDLKKILLRRNDLLNQDVVLVRVFETHYHRSCIHGLGLFDDGKRRGEEQQPFFFSDDM